LWQLEVDVLQLVHPKRMTERQIELVDCALRQVTRISRSVWAEIPMHLHPFFARYMHADVWTGESDPHDLSEAALKIIRDAITRTGEFAEDEE
jgi:hypothetical protein